MISTGREYYRYQAVNKPERISCKIQTLTETNIDRTIRLESGIYMCWIPYDQPIRSRCNWVKDKFSDSSETITAK